MKPFAAAQAFADSKNLSFYIVLGRAYADAGHKSSDEEREATEFEREMWIALGGPDITNEGFWRAMNEEDP